MYVAIGDRLGQGRNVREWGLVRGWRGLLQIG